MRVTVTTRVFKFNHPKFIEALVPGPYTISFGNVVRYFSACADFESWE